MASSSLQRRLLRRKNLLAAAIMATGGFVAADLHAASTWTVNSCSDSVTGSLGSKSGTLRFTAQNALSGDTIDLSQLPTTYGCSTISLQTGAVILAQNSLTLKGPSANPVTVTGKYCSSISSCTTEPDRLFKHTGTGTLDIYGLQLTKGYLTSPTATLSGACVYSAGNIIFDHSSATACKLKAGSGAADGGAILAKGTLSLVASTVSGNSAYSTSGFVFGGGIFAIDTVDIRNSEIRNNTAKTKSTAQHGYGGGVFTGGSLYLLGSTISGNYAISNFGGIYVNQSGPATKTVTVRNSTISGNSAGNLVGGVFTTAHLVRFDNSTVAFNTAAHDSVGTFPNISYYAPGVSLAVVGSNITLTLQSTVMANNTANFDEYDLSVVDSATNTITIGGSNNIVRATFATAPAGTFTRLVCPLLGPLRDNGGGIPTHALLSHSPGIDQGNNVFGLGVDERGSPFARVSGASADMGAYEVQQLDVLFNTSFETCPTLF
ncbi:MAG: choice-of-anchor Q domain-containing protein [Rudaea sp.]